MKQSGRIFLGVTFFFFVTSIIAAACPPDSVQVGSVCVDKYEASVWSIDPANKGLIGKVRQGKAALSHLSEGGAVQRGANADDYDLAGCADNGNGCTNVYAVSILGVTPARSITWFQAAAACRNAGKRLLTNAEWQVAAFGTPDPGAAGNGVTTCNTAAPELMPTGSARNCVSDVGVFDMVGNLWEWVADWIQGDTNPWAPVTGGKTNAAYGNDLMSGTNPAQTQGDGQNFPAAIERGGSFNYGNHTDAGVFALSAAQAPSADFVDLGFRCGR
jgi:sulfatase-modifying factor enzyme 1